MFEKIKSKIPFKIQEIQKTNMGLTNHNYIIKIANKKYILRYPLDDIKHLFNPKNEEKVLNTIEKQDYILPVKYYHKGIQIVEYRENLQTFSQVNKDSRIKEVAKLMKNFHQSDLKVDFDFDPLKQIYLYKNNIKNLNIDLSNYKDLFEKLENHTFKPVLCHNDWVDGNICFIEDKSYLIDFEYAGNNDPLFDVMSFLTENDLSNKERSEFLAYMFEDGISNKDYETLKMYRDINNLLWYLWAIMMYEFRKENIYQEIADIKLKQLTEEYEKDLWDISRKPSY